MSLFRSGRSNPVRAAALAVAVAALGWNRPAGAELLVVNEPIDGGERTIFRLTVTPAAEPRPALRYRLLPNAADLRPGNAALFYTRAFAEGTVSGKWQAMADKYGFDVVHGDNKHNGWYSIDTPLNELPIDNVRAAAATFDTIVEQFVARATVRRDCDWGHQIHEIDGVDVISTILPEMQETRSLSRALVLRTRVAVADGDFPRAVEHLKMNYRLAQNAAAGPFLVSGLVGIAEASMGNAEVIELIGAKGSPNLYWAIAEMPRPFIDLAPSVRYEMSLGIRMFPSLKDAENQEHSPDEWARLLVKDLIDAAPAIGNGPRWSELRARLSATGFSLLYYRPAKSRLRVAGIGAERVEQMPVGQVMAIDAAREYRRLADEIEKWWYVPLQVARKRGREADQMLNVNKFDGGFGQVLAALLMPALSSAREAQARLDWQLNAIQAVEAIRMHAAEAEKLPATLEEITCVPVPDNPATDQSYLYRLDGETAILELPASDGFHNIEWRFEIKLAK